MTECLITTTILHLYELRNRKVIIGTAAWEVIVKLPLRTFLKETTTLLFVTNGKIGIKCFSRFLLVAHGWKPSNPYFHGPIRRRIRGRKNIDFFPNNVVWTFWGEGFCSRRFQIETLYRKKGLIIKSQPVKSERCLC